MTIRWHVLVFLGIALTSSACSALDMAGNIGGSWTIKVTSIKEARFRTTVRQQYDFSCGSAALATLLTHHYGNPVSEQQAFKSMYERGDQAKIRKEGFSLLDIKNYLEANGYQADGVEASLQDLEDAGIPAIVLIRENNYSHFVVIKGIRNKEVLVGDPAAGSKVYPQDQFEKLLLNKILFVIRDRQQIAKQRFNTAQEWAANPKAPLGDGLSRDSLANVTFLRPGRNDF